MPGEPPPGYLVCVICGTWALRQEAGLDFGRKSDGSLHDCGYCAACWRKRSQHKTVDALIAEALGGAK